MKHSITHEDICEWADLFISSGVLGFQFLQQASGGFRVQVVYKKDRESDAAEAAGMLAQQLRLYDTVLERINFIRQVNRVEIEKRQLIERQEAYDHQVMVELEMLKDPLDITPFEQYETVEYLH